ncbi:hypothetical protein C7H19_05750 [Aphanothece hegewaldii CCALA 016]|uniref:Uncharacterized protein n=1 Tax=Aphanothece hegewaldii CCALA 016 TaxID=2107694 RepID=A0A2T1M1B6_9CHRO|nr:hypothetical protein [Aphanothece hegewaldii]PSF38488.1 hypothetical protein C7H19_05750 [Aphanothece hegewaldii CCALA 016]
MSKIRKLLEQIAAQENQLRVTQFFAPCVKGGKVKTKVAGMIYKFAPKPQNFEGWGIFQAENEKIAKLVDQADLWQISEYLNYFPSFRLRLAYRLSGKTWLAYPVSEADVKQRLGKVKPIPVHLVIEGGRFEQIIARFDGHTWWFEEVDRRGDFKIVDQLKSSLKQLVSVQKLSIKGMTPEIKTVYDLVTQKTEGFTQYSDERRLKNALKLGGGDLQEFQDRGDYWTVNWITSDGEHHISAISKNDLTVVSSGICLSGKDRDFDLQSLVGVIEHR